MGLQNSKVDDSKQGKYDVFLSFNDEYVPYFVDDLIAALQRKDVHTFRADKMLKKGESLPTEIFEAIEGSRICIVVFTFNYAASVWCLEELAKIAEDISKPEVLPVFYRVHPAEVQKHGKCYEGAFAEHEEKFQSNLHEVQKWRLAMKEVGSIKKGWHVWNGSESEVIDGIVKFALKTLGRNDNDDLVGMGTRVSALENHLNIRQGDDNVRFVGIYGMSGTGKTCLAKVVYEKISHHFKAHSFLFNVSHVIANYSHGLIRLQKQLLYETGMEGDADTSNHGMETTCIRDHLRCRKTLLVLDDINELEQLEALAGNFDWFGPGSRIIITTRDENVLRNRGVENIFKVQLLNKNEAGQLFCRIAFKSDCPLEAYKELMDDVAEYAKGLPLVIRSLGSTLAGLSPSECKRVLERLQKSLDKNITLHLKSSLFGLKIEEKEMFLHIACFFDGEDESHVRKVLYSCGYPESGIRVLQNKSLINIVNGKIYMHDLLQQVGREMVQEESDRNPRRRSLLWSIEDVLDAKKGIKRVKAIVLKPQEILQENLLRAEVLSKMRNLKLMIFHNVKFSGDLNHLSNELRYILWDKYPFNCLPSSFEAQKLVELILPNSCIKKLWEDNKVIPNLTNLDLRGSKYFIRMPSFAAFRNLENLNLEGCFKLAQLDSSITTLQNLKQLNLRNCVGLVSIPNSLFDDRENLKTLNLAGCSNLVKYFSFDPLRSLLDAKLLRDRYYPILAKCVVFSFLFPANKLVFGCLTVTNLYAILFRLDQVLVI